jgi:hypothetical protein
MDKAASGEEIASKGLFYSENNVYYKKHNSERGQNARKVLDNLPGGLTIR